MVQTKVIDDYTFQSTTDDTTITISDDKFAELFIIQKLIDAIEKLTRRLDR